MAAVQGDAGILEPVSRLHDVAAMSELGQNAKYPERADVFRFGFHTGPNLAVRF
jgi:hypothetical protein